MRACLAMNLRVLRRRFACAACSGRGGRENAVGKGRAAFPRTQLRLRDGFTVVLDRILFCLGAERTKKQFSAAEGSGLPFCVPERFCRTQPVPASFFSCTGSRSAGKNVFFPCRPCRAGLSRGRVGQGRKLRLSGRFRRGGTTGRNSQ